MSSYVIDKKSYTRAAAVLAAIGTQKDYYGDPMIFKYNADTGKPFDALDIRSEIMRLYCLNLKSVNLQYKDDFAGDLTMYQGEFVKYFNAALKLFKKAYINGSTAEKNEFNHLCYYILDFFSSVYYQIEDDECSTEARHIIDFYIKSLLKIMKKINYTEESLCWGSFDFFESEDDF